MGLDVYLYRYENAESYLAALEAVRGIDEEAREERLAAVAPFGLTLDEYGSVEDSGEKVERDSSKHPDHMFKVGYFRSSYNNGGLNAVARTLLDGRDLAWVFGSGDREYHVRPDWKASRERALVFLRDLQAEIDLTGGVVVHKFTPNVFLGGADLVASEADAYARFRKAVQDRKAGPPRKPFEKGDKRDWWASRDGHFFFGYEGDDSYPLRVLGVFCGAERGFAAALGLSPGGQATPAFYAVATSEDRLAWYVKAAEIVVETCDWVLAQPNPDQFLFHWSG